MLAQRIGESTKASLFLMHSLVLRETVLGGTKADWDGQSRLVPSGLTFGSSYTYTGHGKGLSVELLALTSQGDIGSRTFGGTSLPYRLDASKDTFTLRKDLFANDRETAEGVRIALRPLTGKVMQ